MSTSVKRPLNSLYVHVPFCKEKCYYCSFVSLVDKNNCKQTYINALLQEVSTSLKYHTGVKLNSIYIGGGTPSLLELFQVKSILDSILKYCKIDSNTEITIEVNPGTVDFDYLKGLREIGVNRLSIGVQSFDDNILKKINRIHNADEAINTVQTARKAGFDNISIDLINGLPDQTLEIWTDTLKQALKLDIQHISTYGLKIEKGTVFAKKLPENLPDDELQARMYLKTIEILESNGFIQYEISNYSKFGRESKHNLAYWKNEEYFGFGLGAHGYVDGNRYSNISDLDEYIKNPLQKAEVHRVSYKEMIEEALFLGLRLKQGINFENFKKEYGFDVRTEFNAIIEKYQGYGLFQVKDNTLSFTDEGILLSNDILAEFIG